MVDTTNNNEGDSMSKEVEHIAPSTVTQHEPGDVERVRLWGWGGIRERNSDTPVKALLFGELVKRALRVTERYQSDLYHDAQWVEHYVTRPMTFYFTARTYGTFIGTEPMFKADGGHESFRNYVVELVCEGEEKDGEWYAVFTRIASTPEAVAAFTNDFAIIEYEVKRVAGPPQPKAGPPQPKASIVEEIERLTSGEFDVGDDGSIYMITDSRWVNEETA